MYVANLSKVRKTLHTKAQEVCLRVIHTSQRLDDEGLQSVGEPGVTHHERLEGLVGGQFLG